MISCSGEVSDIPAGSKRSAEELSLSERKILSALASLGGKATLGEISNTVNFKGPVQLMNALNWLKAKGYVRVDEKMLRFYALKEQGAREKLPERVLLETISSGDISIEEAASKLSDRRLIGVGVGWLRRKGWADLTEDKKLHLTDSGRKALSMPGEDELLLDSMLRGEVEENVGNAAVLKDLLSRRDYIRLIERMVREVSMLPKGEEAVRAGLSLEEDLAQLTPELLKSGKWRGFRLRPYDMSAPVPAMAGARLHPVARTIRQISGVFAEMGFSEIEDAYVQNTFWDMDALFTPQDHPARDMQDTFYLSSPAEIKPEAAVARRVREAHETGGRTGSSGWRYCWSASEARKTLLRTHTTVATIRYLASHRKPPVKVFSVGRIFRREAMDSTHLSEFYQIEGVLMEKGASMDMLCSVLREFYRKMGLSEIRLRPGYFPYTEPSMEVDVLYNGKWIEMGGSGIFRPEVLRPLGIRHPVLAWGLGLERLVMLRNGLTDVRDLYISDISALKKMPSV